MELLRPTMKLSLAGMFRGHANACSKLWLPIGSIFRPERGGLTAMSVICSFETPSKRLQASP
jgi:hypothetical protein